MGSKKAEKQTAIAPSRRNPKLQTKHLAVNKPKSKSKEKKRKQLNANNGRQIMDKKTHTSSDNEDIGAQAASPSQIRSFFLDQFQSANGVQISSLELESIKGTSILELSQSLGQGVESLVEHMKAAFGSSWKEMLCDAKLREEKVDPGSPAVLFVSPSALRSIELLRGLRSLTQECHAVKLFSKHMKVEEQLGYDDKIKISLSKASAMLNFLICTLGNDESYIKIIKGHTAAELISLHVALLKNRVNIASGTPSRIKKLIDIEALGLSRLSVIVLDIHQDIKGYSLLTLPQVRDEFWDLYKSYFHQRLLSGDIRVCLFGPLLASKPKKSKKST